MKPLPITLATLVVLFAAIQLVPYGHVHTNPPAGPSPAWDSPRTITLAKRACFDCHSNETRWPWYASVAPVSWRLTGHVERGRRKLNLTDFRPTTEDTREAAGEAGESVRKGEMPPNDYLLMHPEAHLTVDEKQALAHGLDATFATFAKKEHAADGERRE